MRGRTRWVVGNELAIHGDGGVELLGIFIELRDARANVVRPRVAWRDLEKCQVLLKSELGLPTLLIDSAQVVANRWVLGIELLGRDECFLSHDHVIELQRSLSEFLASLAVSRF